MNTAVSWGLWFKIRLQSHIRRLGYDNSAPISSDTDEIEPFKMIKPTLFYKPPEFANRLHMSMWNISLTFLSWEISFVSYV